MFIRKAHDDDWIFELLEKVVIKQSVLNLVACFACCLGDLCKLAPNEESTGDVIELNRMFPLPPSAKWQEPSIDAGWRSIG